MLAGEIKIYASDYIKENVHVPVIRVKFSLHGKFNCLVFLIWVYSKFASIIQMQGFQFFNYKDQFIYCCAHIRTVENDDKSFAS